VSLGSPNQFPFSIETIFLAVPIVFFPATTHVAVIMEQGKAFPLILT
jgi:hypothetical protein